MPNDVKILIPEITNVLARNKTKATFGALCEMLGFGKPKTIMTPFSKSPNNRWIVNEQTAIATGYPREFLDEEYLSQACEISDGDSLFAFLAELSMTGKITSDHGNLLDFLSPQA